MTLPALIVTSAVLIVSLPFDRFFSKVATNAHNKIPRIPPLYSFASF